jgi:hypothetical protein
MEKWPPATYDQFWQRVCEAIFVKNPDWPSIVKQLPDKLDIQTVLRRTISTDVIMSVKARAQGWIGKAIVVQNNANPYREGDFYMTPLRWAYLQVFGQFQLLEGFVNLLSINGEMINPKNWQPDLADQLIELAQAVTYFSAYLLLCDEGRLPEPMTSSAWRICKLDDPLLVEPIRDEVRKITETLSSKTRDYGQAFLRHGILGLIHRLWDKIARYATLSAENRPSKFESKRDTVTDMLGYSVLIWSILEDIKAHSPVVISTGELIQ